MVGGDGNIGWFVRRSRGEEYTKQMSAVAQGCVVLCFNIDIARLISGWEGAPLEVGAVTGIDKNGMMEGG